MVIGSPDPLRQLYGELAEKFEEKLLRVANNFARGNEGGQALERVEDQEVELPEVRGKEEQGTIAVRCASYHSILVSITEEERERWVSGYEKDPNFRKILVGLKSDSQKNQVL